MTGGLYLFPMHLLQPHNATDGATQTQSIQTRTAGVCDGDIDAMPSERSIDLRVNLPHPGEFPILAASQLLEAERRLVDLLARLEVEMERVTHEEEQKKIARGETVLKYFKGSDLLLPTSSWDESMLAKVTQRLKNNEVHTTSDPMSSSLAHRRKMTGLLSGKPYKEVVVDAKLVTEKEEALRKRFSECIDHTSHPIRDGYFEGKLLDTKKSNSSSPRRSRSPHSNKTTQRKISRGLAIAMSPSMFSASSKKSNSPPSGSVQQVAGDQRGKQRRVSLKR